MKSNPIPPLNHRKTNEKGPDLSLGSKVVSVKIMVEEFMMRREIDGQEEGRIS